MEARPFTPSNFGPQHVAESLGQDISATPFPAGSCGLNPGWVAVPEMVLHVYRGLEIDATRSMGFLLEERERLLAELEKVRESLRVVQMRDLAWPSGLVEDLRPSASERPVEAEPVVEGPGPTAPVTDEVLDLAVPVEVDPLSASVLPPVALRAVEVPPAPARSVTPVGQVWPRPGDPIADAGPLVAGAVRDCLRSVAASVVVPSALRQWVSVTARRTLADPVARLDRLAELARAMPRFTAAQLPTEDVFGAAGAWISEIDVADAGAHLRAFVALDTIAVSGVDPDGRLFGAAAAAWRARVGSMAASCEHEPLLTIAAQQMIVALAAGQVERARMFAEVVRAVAPSVHPDPSRRSEWLGRAVVLPLRDADVDVRPVRSALTDAAHDLFRGVFGGAPMTLAQGADLYCSIVMADLESCVNGRVLDACLRALLVRQGVTGLGRLPREPAPPSPRAHRKAAPVSAGCRAPGRLRWALRELGLPIEPWAAARCGDGADTMPSAVPPTCTWTPPICRGAPLGSGRRALRSSGFGRRSDEVSIAHARPDRPHRGARLDPRLAGPSPSVRRLGAVYLDVTMHIALDTSPGLTPGLHP